MVKLQRVVGQSLTIRIPKKKLQWNWTDQAQVAAEWIQYPEFQGFRQAQITQKLFPSEKKSQPNLNLLPTGASQMLTSSGVRAAPQVLTPLVVGVAPHVLASGLVADPAHVLACPAVGDPAPVLACLAVGVPAPVLACVGPVVADISCCGVSSSGAYSRSMDPIAPRYCSQHPLGTYLMMKMQAPVCIDAGASVYDHAVVKIEDDGGMMLPGDVASQRRTLLDLIEDATHQVLCTGSGRRSSSSDWHTNLADHQ